MSARSDFTTRHAQDGVALVTSLVILLVLTVLGIAAMRTSSLEERMAGNVQDAIHAFEAAESGLNAAMNDSGALSLTTVVTRTYDFGGTRAETTTRFNQFSPPKRGPKSSSATQFEAANFDQTSKGEVGAQTDKNLAQSTLHRGIAQLVPKAQ